MQSSKQDLLHKSLKLFFKIHFLADKRSKRAEARLQERFQAEDAEFINDDEDDEDVISGADNIIDNEIDEQQPNRIVEDAARSHEIQPDSSSAGPVRQTIPLQVQDNLNNTKSEDRQGGSEELADEGENAPSQLMDTSEHYAPH